MAIITEIEMDNMALDPDIKSVLYINYHNTASVRIKLQHEPEYIDLRKKDAIVIAKSLGVTGEDLE